MRWLTNGKTCNSLTSDNKCNSHTSETTAKHFKPIFVLGNISDIKHVLPFFYSAIMLAQAGLHTDGAGKRLAATFTAVRHNLQLSKGVLGIEVDCSGDRC